VTEHPACRKSSADAFLMPPEVAIGAVKLPLPYSLGGNWPVADMTKDKDTIWTYTTPLPSGVFTYGFSLTAPSRARRAAPSGFRRSWTRTIGQWNETKDGVVDGSIQRNSQVYVPSNPNFGTVDYSWQGPAKQQGKLTHITYFGAE
jgi:hypothetical protein